MVTDDLMMRWARQYYHPWCWSVLHWMYQIITLTSLWARCVSNHQIHECLLNRPSRRRSKKTSKLRVTGLCAGNSTETGEFPAQLASNAENVSIWWRHHVSTIKVIRVLCLYKRGLFGYWLIWWQGFELNIWTFLSIDRVRNRCLYSLICKCFWFCFYSQFDSVAAVSSIVSWCFIVFMALDHHMK